MYNYVYVITLKKTIVNIINSRLKIIIKNIISLNDIFPDAMNLRVDFLF